MPHHNTPTQTFLPPGLAWPACAARCRPRAPHPSCRPAGPPPAPDLALPALRAPLACMDRCPHCRAAGAEPVRPAAVPARRSGDSGARGRLGCVPGCGGAPRRTRWQARDSQAVSRLPARVARLPQHAPFRLNTLRCPVGAPLGPEMHLGRSSAEPRWAPRPHPTGLAGGQGSRCWRLFAPLAGHLLMTGQLPAGRAHQNPEETWNGTWRGGQWSEHVTCSFDELITLYFWCSLSWEHVDGWCLDLCTTHVTPACANRANCGCHKTFQCSRLPQHGFPWGILAAATWVE